MSDFNHIWLDKPYNELTDKQLKAVADWHQGWGNRDQHRACVHMMALRNQLTAERERADKEALIHRDLREELFHSTQRNVRFKNELTAERERADRAAHDCNGLSLDVQMLKAELAALRALILHETGEDKDGLMPHEPREALLILRRTALEGK